MHAALKTQSTPEQTDNYSAPLNVTEAARHLGVSASYLNRLRTTGGGPIFIKMGTRITYRVSDLNAYQAKHARTSTARG